MQSFSNLIKQTFKPHIAVVDLRLPGKILKWTGLFLLVVFCLLFYGFVKDAQTKFLPNTIIAEQAVGGLTAKESLQLLNQLELAPPLHTIELVSPTSTLASTSAELSAQFTADQSVAELLTGQQQNFADWLFRLLFSQPTAQYELPIIYNQKKLNEMVGWLKQATDGEPRQPAVSLTTSGVTSSLVIDRGQTAFLLNQAETLAKINVVLEEVNRNRLDQLTGSSLSISAVSDTLSQHLTDEQVTLAQARAGGLVGESLILGEQETRQVIPDTMLVTFLKLPDGYREDSLTELLTEWETALNREPSNAEFEYNPDTLQVTNFIPHRDGLTLNLGKTKQSILAGLYELEHTDTTNLPEQSLRKDLVLQVEPPAITLADTNDLGIAQRIGFGESWYYHSIPNRIHNVSLTTNRISLTIVPPGSEFSFNQTLGEVSAATGFRSAYIISGGQTLLGDGGGVCQVSTTLFRALLDSGLKVTRRLQHSYRVSYYEIDRQPGFDATVYAGNVDLRFVNDTDHHLLIYGQANPDALYMTVEIYGTSDGRTTKISNYQTWDYRAPLAPEYAPDPSLAPGQLRQIDWAASGIKAQFTHTVRDRDGEIMSEKTYYSNYRPWAAKFLQGV